MRAEQFTRELGGRWFGRFGIARRPAHDDRQPSLSIADGKKVKLQVPCHGGCNFRDVLDALEKLGIGSALKAETRIQRRDRHQFPQPDMRKLVEIFWRQAMPLHGTAGESYLRSRHIVCDLPVSSRFHNHLRHYTGMFFSAMVARVDHVAAGLVGLHRTFLDAATNQKATIEPVKAMLGPCRGGAVHLRKGSRALAVAEGIETAMSLTQDLDDEVALWSALSAPGIAGLVLPDPELFGRRLLIATDGDSPGRRAGASLGERAKALGWTVEVTSAPDCQDFNDLVRSAGHG